MLPNDYYHRGNSFPTIDPRQERQDKIDELENELDAIESRIYSYKCSFRMNPHLLPSSMTSALAELGRREATINYQLVSLKRQRSAAEALGSFTTMGIDIITTPTSPGMILSGGYTTTDGTEMAQLGGASGPLYLSEEETTERNCPTCSTCNNETDCWKNKVDDMGRCEWQRNKFTASIKKLKRARREE